MTLRFGCFCSKVTVPCTFCLAPYNLHLTSCTLHRTLYILYLISCTISLALFPSHLTPCTLYYAPICTIQLRAKKKTIFSRVHATLQVTLSVCRLVGLSVGRSVGWSVCRSVGPTLLFLRF